MYSCKDLRICFGMIFLAGIIPLIFGLAFLHQKGDCLHGIECHTPYNTTLTQTPCSLANCIQGDCVQFIRKELGCCRPQNQAAFGALFFGVGLLIGLVCIMMMDCISFYYPGCGRRYISQVLVVISISMYISAIILSSLLIFIPHQFDCESGSYCSFEDTQDLQNPCTVAKCNPGQCVLAISGDLWKCETQGPGLLAYCISLVFSVSSAATLYLVYYESWNQR